MSQENEQEVIKSEGLRIFIMWLTALCMAGILVYVLNGINAPVLAYALILTISGAFLLMGALMQKNYNQREARNKIVEESTKQE